MSGCHQPRRDADAEAASVSPPDLANGASRRGNAPRLARFRSDSGAAIWRRRAFRAMTAALGVSLPLRTSACASVPARTLTRSACLRSRSARNNGADGLSPHEVLRLNWGGHIAPDPSDGVEKAITIPHVRCAQKASARSCVTTACSHRPKAITQANAWRPPRGRASRPRAAPSECRPALARTWRGLHPPVFPDIAAPRRRRTARRPCPTHRSCW
jgi:hypothetical protein